MWRYIVKRLIALVIVLLCVAVIIFCVLWFMPGDPAEVILGLTVPEADREALRVKMGWNDPFLVQLGRYLRDVFLHLDFGESYQYKVPVTQGFMQFLPRTLTLGLISVFIQTVIGIPLGVSAAIHRNTLQDQGLLVFAMVFISVPQFWFALMMVVLFSVKLGWFPVSGMVSANAGYTGFRLLLDRAWHYILPLIVIVAANLGSMTRYVRAAMIDVLSMDYIRTARAKGLKEKVVIYSHAWRNALLPVITQIISWFLRLFAGSVVIESTFAFSGMGTLNVTALNTLDYELAIAINLFFCLVSLLGILICDLAYGLVDPRIRVSK